MIASITDLRRHMKDVLLALERTERVTLTYRGKVIGVMSGVIAPQGEKARKAAPRMREHPFFGMNKGDTRPVQQVMDELRRWRKA